jgi:hypothetical protein
LCEAGLCQWPYNQIYGSEAIVMFNFQALTQDRFFLFDRLMKRGTQFVLKPLTRHFDDIKACFARGHGQVFVRLTDKIQNFILFIY